MIRVWAPRVRQERQPHMHSSSGRATRASRVSRSREAKSPHWIFLWELEIGKKVYLKISPPTQTITTGMTNDTKQMLYCFVQNFAKWPTPVR